MADKPIPFSDPMVAALLAGRKTKTRRAIPENVVDAYYEYDDWCSNVSAGVPTSRQWEKEFFLERCRYAVGDRLWVRETYYQFGHWGLIQDAKTKGGKPKWGFVADDPDIRFEMGSYLKAMNRADPHRPAWHKRLGRFMPRVASRLTLIVESVKVERLQDISEEDAIAEGMRQEYCPGEEAHGAWTGGIDYLYGWNARGAFHRTWELINGPGSWDANPWVAAIGFSVVHANIDSIGASHV